MTFAEELKALFEKHNVTFDFDSEIDEVRFYANGDYLRHVALKSDRYLQTYENATTSLEVYEQSTRIF